MSGFSAEWLRLREPFDREARDAAWPALRDALPRRSGEPMRIVDLGCGTGANLRWLAPRLGGVQHWQAIDHDTALLATWPEALHDWAAAEGHRLRSEGAVLEVEGEGFLARVQRRQLDLAAHLDEIPWAEADLVTAAALIDLVSADWLDRLVAHCRAAGADVLFTLTVDGRIDWSPADSDDAAVARGFAQHQGRDKGFGPALGPDAVAHAVRRLEDGGYDVQQARSDWVATDRLQLALIDGMVMAAAQQDPSMQHTVQSWRERRQALCAGASLRVGHVDIVARAAG